MPVNFNMAFEPHIRGVRNLANFSREAAKRVPVVFISTIATAGAWSGDCPVPEQPLRDLGLATGGYGRSKLVSSLVLDKAAKITDVPAIVIHVGQTAGPKSGSSAWNKQEWLPSLVASSAHLGVLPGDLGQATRVDWTPTEGIAHEVLEVSGITSPVTADAYLHGVNPRATEWATLVPAIRAFYGDHIKRVVSFSEWIAALEASMVSGEETRNNSNNPGIKLIDTYKAWD